MSRPARQSVRFVVPEQAQISGGRVYNTELARALRAADWEVETHELPGHWPDPEPAERERLLQTLTKQPTVPVVVDGLVGSACPVELTAAVAAGVMVILMVHLPLPAETGLPSHVAQRREQLEREAISAATAVAAPSQWAANDLLRRYGRADVRVLTPGAHEGPLAQGSSPARLTMIGALTPVKNHTTVLSALLALSHLAWTLRVIGPQPDPETLAHLRRQLAQPPLASRVSLTGGLTGSALESQWQATDLLLVPSHTETFGLVVTEALARGIPAIVARGTGAVEAARLGSGAELAGAEADADNSDQWRHLLTEWLTQPSQRAQWRERALQSRTRLRRWSETAHDLAHLVRSCQ